MTTYPTLDDLRDFFQKNEFGKRVLDDVCDRFTDAKRIVKEIEELLGINDEHYQKENPVDQYLRIAQEALSS